MTDPQPASDLLTDEVTEIVAWADSPEGQQAIGELFGKFPGPGQV